MNTPIPQKNPLKISRNILFFAIIGIVIILYLPSLIALFFLSYGSDAHEYILIVPFVSGYFFFKKRKIIAQHMTYSPVPACLIALSGILVWALQMAPFSWQFHHSLQLKILSMLLVFTGGTIGIFGTQIFKNALFPVIFLFLMIPLPSAAVNGIISFYQVGTAAVVDIIFKLCGVDYFREGFSFHLSKLSVNIAPQCSGIHSSSALIITGIIAGQFFLKTLVGKTIFIFLTIPLVLIKNGIRVATLSILGAYVNMSFINGDLHHKGGIVFFLVALVFLFGGMFIIKRLER